MERWGKMGSEDDGRPNKDMILAKGNQSAKATRTKVIPKRVTHKEANEEWLGKEKFQY